MPTIELHVYLSDADLAEAAEDVERLLDDDAALDLGPACRRLLQALDDAITAAVADGAAASKAARARSR